MSGAACEYAVVGNGLIGAAVAFELSGASSDVRVFGAGYGDEDTYYSSHEDDARIARCFHPDPYWEGLAERNVVKLEALMRATGVPVFRRVPVLYRYPHEHRLRSRHLTRRRPGLGDGVAGRFDREDREGGIIHPRRYVAALNGAAERNGARVARCVVRVIEPAPGSLRLRTDHGEVRAGHVVDARGLYSDHVANGTVRVVGKIFVVVEAADAVDADAARPFCFIDGTLAGGPFEDAYGCHRYTRAAGRPVSKFGFSERVPITLDGAGAVTRWFRGDFRGYPHLAEARAWATEFCGGDGLAVRIKPCAFTVTTSRRPVMESRARRTIVTGCNGMAAKCCQALAEDIVTRVRACAA